MLKAFLKDTVIYAVGVFSIRLINFILMPFLTRKLQPAEYGMITLLLTLAPIVLYTITLQISQAIPKFAANNADVNLRENYTSTGLWYVIFIYILFYILASLFPQLSQMLLGIPNQDGLITLALINICLFGIFTYLETQLRWDKKAVEYTIVAVVIMILSLILIVWLTFLNMGLKGYFIGSAVAQSIGCFMAFYYGRNNYKFVFSKEQLLEMLRFTYPLAISAIGSYIYMNLNQWLIKFLCGLSAVGIYGVTSRFASIVSVAFGCVSLSITPMIYSDYRKKTMPDFISFLFRACLLFSLWCAAIFVVFSQQIISLVVGENFFRAGDYVPLVLLSYTFSSLYIFTPGQWIFNKTKEMAAINLIAGAINLLAGFILIKFYLISGAVLALFITSLFQLGLNMYFNNKYYYIDFKIFNVICALILFLAFYIINYRSVTLLIIFIITSSLFLIKKSDVINLVITDPN